MIERDLRTRAETGEWHDRGKLEFTSKAVSEYNVYDQQMHCQSSFLLTQKAMQVEERIQRSGIPTHEKTIRARDSWRIQALLRTSTSE